jgi:hypothetical protein
MATDKPKRPVGRPPKGAPKPIPAPAQSVIGFVLRTRKPRDAA